MDTDTPYVWLEKAAEREPDAPALILADRVVSYSDLEYQVRARTRSLAHVVSPGSIVPAPMRLDLPSIVEMVAVMRSGAVVLPYADRRPEVNGVLRPGTAVCVATSGSGGVSKLVPLSYANIAASVRASRSRLGTGATDRWLATLPLTHVGGLSVIWRSLASGGAAVVAPFDDAIVDIVERTRPTVASLVPTMVHRLLDRSPESLAAIDLILIGGTHLPRRLIARARERGIGLVPTYGMTETASQIATAAPGVDAGIGDVVGSPLDGFSVIIRGDAGPVGPDQVGVIEVEGPAVFHGYLGEPARTGPFRTSDLGFMTEDGRLAVVGRVDDVVVSGGENVSLAAVRDAIAEIEGVADAAAVGVDDPEWGTIVCALVEVSGILAADDLRESVASLLPEHARPKRWIIGTVPILENGKPDTSAIRRMFADE
ncbi:MAG: o-succinylbenzoate--CoA ligase [Acidimicrobiia bacterium]|nr:MAG: o-succinylbenzoate--CoA ligase [Acidimicrobiia bacterium]